MDDEQGTTRGTGPPDEAFTAFVAARWGARRTMLTTYTSWWRRHRGRERLTDDAGERAGADSAALEAVVARSELWPHLRRLPRGQRAALRVALEAGRAPASERSRA